MATFLIIQEQLGDELQQTSELAEVPVDLYTSDNRSSEMKWLLQFIRMNSDHTKNRVYTHNV